jgi:hypothetical protein
MHMFDSLFYMIAIEFSFLLSIEYLFLFILPFLGS